MADTIPIKPDPEAFDKLMRAQALALRGGDRPPAGKKDGEEGRQQLRAAMLAAMGPTPAKPCPLEAKILGTLKRDDYRIEKVIFQSQPDVWVTASAYVPEPDRGR